MLGWLAHLSTVYYQSRRRKQLLRREGDEPAPRETSQLTEEPNTNLFHSPDTDTITHLETQGLTHTPPKDLSHARQSRPLPEDLSLRPITPVSTCHKHLSLHRNGKGKRHYSKVLVFKLHPPVPLQVVLLVLVRVLRCRGMKKHSQHSKSQP